MAGETIITVVGNLTADPEMRFTPSGAAVSSFAIASTPRFFDRQANQWKDGETLFVRCTLWRESAENAVESLTKGTRVIAQGRLQARSFQTKERENRTSWELQVDEIGPSLRFATASVQRSRNTGGASNGPGGLGNSNSNPHGFADTQPQDPWGGQPSGGGSWGTPDNGEPPF